jgi:uncharacterized protein
MLFREVSKNGDRLSALGYGCMRFPQKRLSIDEGLAEKQMLLAIEEGVNYFDTAYPYHNGKSETFVGKFFAKNGYREKVRLATKLPHWNTPNRGEMDKMLDMQLAKMETDYLDYYLVHNLNGDSWETAKSNGVMEFLDGALESGRIRNCGFSFHGPADDFKKIVDDYDWTLCQIQYNLLDTKNQAGKSGLKYAASKNLAVVVMEPLRGGNLAKTPPPAVAKIWDQADTKRTPVEWALRFVWNHPEVTMVLSGMNEDEHIRENIDIASVAAPDTLTKNELSLIREARRSFNEVMKVGCTGCQYCMPCPSGVNIPACFEYYNSRHAFKDRMARFMYLGGNGGLFSGKTALASQCTECGECIEKCPQSLAIPEYLKDVSKDMEGIMAKPLMWLIKKVMKVKKR